MDASAITEQVLNGASGVGTVLLLVLAWRSGLLTALLKGANGTDDRLGAIEEGLRTLADNHATHIEEGVKELKETQKDMRETQLKQCQKLEGIDESLKDIVRNGVRIKKV